MWYKEPELVKELHERGFTYTRYVDDISVSSKRISTRKEKSEIVRKIHIMLSSIGVKLNRKKHKIMPRNESQKIHRINVNTNNPTLPKNERKKLNLLFINVNACLMIIFVQKNMKACLIVL